MKAVSLHEAEDLYVAALLRSYLDLPATPDRARTADRVLARSLFTQQVPLDIVRAAFLLASARRTFRPPDASPLAPVQSLHYFLPVIHELRLSPPDNGYIDYLRTRLSCRRP